MAAVGRCDGCGAELGAEVGPQGLCSGCLFKLALPEAKEASSSADDPGSMTFSQAPVEVGERIGPYQVLQKLGEGGMGEVWEAEQKSPVRRKVALKLIKAGMDTEQVVARFESERQALALMNHPNIARVFEAGATDRGRPYFAMEYVKGVPITSYCDTQRLTTGERLELFLQVCNGIQHAHQKGIIHRDIKPSNVLVEIVDGKPVPKIIDFGVAKATQQPLTERTVFTLMGVLIGTPEYMSPEQAGLTALDIDTRTDVYSLGVLLYELVVGALPFESRELREAGYDEIRRKIREDEPSRPSARLRTLDESTSGEAAKRRHTDPASLARELRGDLDWITMKALEKERARRYASPNELGADIRRHLDHEPVAASPPSALYRAQKFTRRHRVGVCFAAVVALLVIGLAVTMTVQAARIAKERDRANIEAATAEQVSEFLVGLFDISDPSKSRGNTITVREVLDDGAEKIERELADQPEVRVRLMNTMGRVYTTLGLYDTAEPLLEQAVEEARTGLETDHPETLETMYRMASTYHMQSRYDEAEPLLWDTLRARERMLGGDHPKTLDTMALLANVIRLRGRLAESEEMWLKLLAMRRLAAPDGDVNTARTLRDMSRLYQDQGRYEQSVAASREALGIFERFLGHDHPNTLTTAHGLASAYLTLGRLDEAAAIGRETLELRRRILGDDHMRTLWNMNMLGDVYRMQGHLPEAEELLSETVDRARRVLGDEHQLTPVAMLNLSVVYKNSGRYDDAERLLRDALAIHIRQRGENHAMTLMIRFHLGMLFAKQGHYDEAETVIVEVLADQRRVLGDDHARTLATAFNLAGTYASMGDREKALDLFREVVEREFEFWGRPSVQLDGSPLSIYYAEPEFEALVTEVMSRFENADADSVPD